MTIFRLDKNKLLPVSSKRFDLEKDIQKLTEENLEVLFGIKLVSGSLNQEFSIGVTEQDFYIDTLAFDESQSSIVIIEYKKDKSFSVIDQGFAYLSAVLNHKADLILELNEKLNKNFRKGDIDWEATRVIFISPEFTNYQRNAINFKDLPIFLYEVNLYEKDLIEYDPIKPYRTTESITKIAKDKTIQKVSSEIKVYSIENHYKKASVKTKEMLDSLRDKIMSLDSNIKEKPVKNYIGYKLNWYNFASIHVFKDKLKIHVRKEKLEADIDKKFKQIPPSYKWGNTPLWWIDMATSEELGYILKVIKESYEAAPDR